ncbi:MAG: alpha/beta fold hydrolase [Oceanicaulis sp.]
MATPISLEDWRAGGETFGYRGYEIFYRTGGDWTDEGRPILVLIHGFPTASWDWAHAWEPLCARFRVAALDMIGFGFSQKPVDYAYSILDQADLHETFLDRLGADAVHILAHDYGDTVAQELLARHIERGAPQGRGLLSICFLNGGLFPEQHRPTFTQRILHSPVGPLVSRAMSRKRFETGFCAVFGPDTRPSATELDAFWAMMNTNGSIRPIGHKLIGYIAERREHRDRWVGALEESPVPMRVIDGALDPVSGAHMVAHYQKLVPDPDTVLLPDVGHYPQLEAPGETLDAFFDFQNRIMTA